MGIHERKEGFRNGVVTQPMSSQLTPSEHMELDGEGAEGGGSCAQGAAQRPAPACPQIEVQRPAVTAGRPRAAQPQARPSVCLSLEVTCIGRKHWKWSVLRAL